MPLTGEYEPGTRELPRHQAKRYEDTGGREGSETSGRPVIVLTSVGAKSGKLRKTVLMRVEHDGRYPLAASLGGAPNHPAWYWNLRENSHVELQDGSKKADYLAHEAHGMERVLWWERAVAAYPDYELYQTQTERLIPVFVLCKIHQ